MKEKETGVGNWCVRVCSCVRGIC